MKTTKEEWLKRFRQQANIWWLYLTETNNEEGYTFDYEDSRNMYDGGLEEIVIDTDEGSDMQFEGVKIEDDVIWVEYTENGYVMDLPAMYVSSDSLKNIYNAMAKYFEKEKQ